jgi:glucose-1-phosphate cytidylyltransferase
MKAVILAGGLGSRLSEETTTRPKPLVEIGGKPILWHIMKIYSAHGINEFIICLGYKGHMIKEFFYNYHLRSSDVTFDIQARSVSVHGSVAEPWKITLIDTGDDSGTGGRLKQAIPHVMNDPAFCLTYGDGVGDIDITKLVAFHMAHGKLATVTATRPLPRFGVMHLDGANVCRFEEKPHGTDDWVNGGFFVLSPKVGEYIADNAAYWEQAPLKKLVEEGELSAFRHTGFWRPMDTLRDKQVLEEAWASGNAPWKVW